ncbi:MAG: DUF4142 domain-containing protein [Gemmatimonadaceae bacterium]
MRKTLMRSVPTAMLAIVAIAGCKGKDNAAAADSAKVADTAAMRAPASDTAAKPATVSNNGWTDAQILAYASAANTGEIEEARLASKKAINPAVKAFARLIMTDHQTMLNDGKNFANQNNIAPDTTKGDVTDAMKDSRKTVRDLTDKAAGKDWDEDYISKQIDGHKAVLDHLKDAAKSTNNAGLRTMLEKASGKVQEHLTKAQDIKEKKLKS